MCCSANTVSMPLLALTKRSGFSADATAEEKSDCVACEGWLRKLSHKGLWQQRYFGLRNGFFNYYSGADKKAVLASIALSNCKACEPVDLTSGEFNLVFQDDSTYSLRSPDSKTTAQWCDALSERIEWARSTRGRANGRNRRGDDDDDDGDGGRRDRRKARRSSDDDRDRPTGPRPGRQAGSKKGDDGSESDTPAPAQRPGGAGRPPIGAASKAKASAEVDSDEDAVVQKKASSKSRADGGRSSLGSATGKGGKDGNAVSKSASRPDSDESDGERAPAVRKPAASSVSAGAGTGLGTRRGSSDEEREDGQDSDADSQPAASKQRKAQRPDVPPAPAYEGWVKKKARTKFGSWQARYLRLHDGVLYWQDSDDSTEYSNSIDVTQVTNVRPAGGRNSTASERKVWILSTTFEPEMQLRAADEAAVSAWVQSIQQAIAHKKQYGASGKSKRRAASDRRSDAGDSEGAADSDEDSDADGSGPGGLPPPPAWYRDYEKPDTTGARWMNASQKALERLFGGIYQSNEGGEEGVGADGDPAERRVVISKLAEAATRACAELEDRSMEARMRGRADIVKHFVSMWDLKMLHELTPLTTGTAPNSLSPKQLLQLIDCIEGHADARKRAVGSMTLSAQEARPGFLLRETRRGLIGRYMDVMGPKLHTLTEKVLARLMQEKGALVRRTLGTRVGTNSPPDLFNLMSEHLKIAKEGGSNALQRRLLSQVMGEVVYYAREVLMGLMDWWARAPAEVDMDYTTAVINDSGLMLDHIEQLEAYFHDALHSDTEALRAGIEEGGTVKGGDLEDDMDRQEWEQAKEDLTAIEQDIPRAKSELINAGCQLTGVLVDIVAEDMKEPLASLFSPAWDKGNHVTIMTVTCSDYLTESRTLLDPFFFDKLGSMVLAHLTEQYTLRLLAPDLVRKDKGSKDMFKGGFTSKYKLTEDRLKKLVGDVVEMGNCFSQFMPREDLSLIMQCLNTAREMLTIDTDNLLTVLEVAIRNNPAVSTHVFLSCERCVALREDLSKAERKSVMDEALKLLRDCGQPPEEDDDLHILGGALGVGVMHGASMSQGATWQPGHVTNAIYRSAFPNAAERSKVLFKDWVPPARPMSPTVPVELKSSSAGLTSPQPASMSLDAFMVNSKGGEVHGSKVSSVSAAASAPAPSTSGKANLLDDDGPAAAPSFTQSQPKERDRGKRRRGRGNDDDD